MMVPRPERPASTPRRDTIGIAVANWWLRRVLTLQCLAALDANHRRGLACVCNRGGAPIPSRPAADDPTFCISCNGPCRDEDDD